MCNPKTPCPWCGHQPYTDTETAAIMGRRTGHRFAIGCSYCEATAPGDKTFAAAVSNWESRGTCRFIVTPEGGLSGADPELILTDEADHVVIDSAFASICKAIVEHIQKESEAVRRVPVCTALAASIKEKYGQEYFDDYYVEISEMVADYVAPGPTAKWQERRSFLEGKRSKRKNR